jgi:hypothetical protein
MSGATLNATEDQIFDALWGFIAALFDPSVQSNIFKGYQNMTSTPLGTYVVLSPGVKIRQNQIVRSYDATAGVMNVERDTEYKYQVDCYGPSAPDYADIIAIAWSSLWACDYFAGNLATPTPGAPLPVTPLYAEEPQQLNIVNAEMQYESRFMLQLHLQSDQVVSLPQDFFTTAPTVTVNVPTDIT